VTYWNPANKATGNYTVKATFKEPKYMNLNDHPHPYGIMIAGNDLGTDKQSYLYCAAYGNAPSSCAIRSGRFRRRQAAHREPRGEQAAGKDQPVSQEIALSVKGTAWNARSTAP